MFKVYQCVVLSEETSYYYRAFVQIWFNRIRRDMYENIYEDCHWMILLNCDFVVIQ